MEKLTEKVVNLKLWRENGVWKYTCEQSFGLGANGIRKFSGTYPKQRTYYHCAMKIRSMRPKEILEHAIFSLERYASDWLISINVSRGGGRYYHEVIDYRSQK